MQPTDQAALPEILVELVLPGSRGFFGFDESCSEENLKTLQAEYADRISEMIFYSVFPPQSREWQPPKIEVQWHADRAILINIQGIEEPGWKAHYRSRILHDVLYEQTYYLRDEDTGALNYDSIQACIPVMALVQALIPSARVDVVQVSRGSAVPRFRAVYSTEHDESHGRTHIAPDLVRELTDIINAMDRATWEAFVPKLAGARRSLEERFPENFMPNHYCPG